jgi:tetratricopeptide (TPR) repeat protein
MQVTVNEAAAALGISIDSVRARLRRGTLERKKVGRRVFVLLDPTATSRDQATTSQETSNATSELREFLASKDQEIDRLVAMLEGNPEAMNREFETAQKLNPEDRDVQSCLNEMDLEIEALVKSVQRTPDEASLRLRLAKRYLLLRDYERAAAQYESFVELKPDNAAGWNNLGICYNKLERLDEAIQAFETAIEHAPQQLHGYVNVADMYQKRGDLALTSEKLEKAVEISPPSEKALTYDKLARSYYLQKKYDLATETLEKALQFASNNPELRDYVQNRRDSDTHTQPREHRSGELPPLFQWSQANGLLFAEYLRGGHYERTQLQKTILAHGGNRSGFGGIDAPLVVGRKFIYRKTQPCLCLRRPVAGAGDRLRGQPGCEIASPRQIGEPEHQFHQRSVGLSGVQPLSSQPPHRPVLAHPRHLLQ